MSVDINPNGAVTEQKSSLSADCQSLHYHLFHAHPQPNRPLCKPVQKVTNKQMEESSNLNVMLRENMSKSAICFM